MRVLFIDEDETAIADGKTILEENGHECKQVDFLDFDNGFSEFSPHIVVLDMMDGGESIDATGIGGKTVFDKIWGSKFCPIVVYSANPELIEDVDADRAKHPLIKKVTKGKNSEDKLLANVQDYQPCVEGILRITEDVNNALNTTLRDVVKHFVGINGIKEADAIQYIGRRRISALMDDTSTRESIAPWEQYIFPPLSDYPKTGDILLNTSTDPSKPESYLLVLTPSCDLVNTEKQKPKVDKVLCAKCENPSLLISKVHGSKKGEIRKNLSSLLNLGYIDECLPLPGLGDIFPPMVANLKALELIAYESIGDGKAYAIIASVDSPFREQVSWAYQNISGRPGVPDRDCKCWAEQYEPKEEKKKGEKK